MGWTPNDPPISPPPFLIIFQIINTKRSTPANLLLAFGASSTACTIKEEGAWTLPFSPSTVKRRFFGRPRAFQLAAGDPTDSSPSDGRLGGRMTGNPWIPAGI
jgi:hypothetical protein